MSIKWLYITAVVILASWLRYRGYKRSVRLERKLDLILESMGLDFDSKAGQIAGNASRAERKRFFRLIKNEPAPKAKKETAESQ